MSKHSPSKAKQNQQKFLQLLQKRIQHQQIIDKLVYGNQPPKPSFMQQSSSSTILNTGRSAMSCASDIHKQVNLLSNLGKFEEEVAQSKWKIKENHLYPSLTLAFSTKDIRVWGQSMEESIFNGELHHFALIVQYFTSHNLWNDLFLLNQNGIFIKILSHAKEPYEEVNLTYSPLTVDEKSLVVEEDGKIYIGYLLLHRTLSYLKNGNFPEVLRMLFGYPYKWFDIQRTQDYFEFQLIIFQNEKHKLQIKMYGKDKVGNLTFIQPSTVLTELIKQYEEVLLIFQEEYCFAKYPLIHHRNHHVVLDLTIDNPTYYLLSVHSNSNLEACKVCILNENSQIVIYFRESNRESKVLYLKKGEYKVYLRGESVEDLVKITLMIESKVILASENLSLKFDQSYNKFSEKIIQQYLKEKGTEKLEKELNELAEKNTEKEAFVVRCHLKILDFYTDFILVKGKQSIRYPQMARLVYEGNEVFSDLDYHKNRKIVEVEKDEVVQVNLSKDQKLLYCGGMDFCMGRICI